MAYLALQWPKLAMTLEFPSRFQLRLGKESDRTVGKHFQAVVVMLAVTGVLFGAVGTRLAQLQLVEGPLNRQRADTNRVRLVPKRPARGALLDRNGEILASSRLSHAISIWPIALPESEWPTVIARLSEILKVPPENIQQRLEQAGYESIEAITVARGISPAQATAIAEFSHALPGVRLEAEAVRNYPNGDLAAHVLGYTGEITQEELDSPKYAEYRLGDIIGQMGAEAAFESMLQGEWGGQQVEVDSSGRVISVLGDKPAVSGNDVQLTIDIEAAESSPSKPSAYTHGGRSWRWSPTRARSWRWRVVRPLTPTSLPPILPMPSGRSCRGQQHFLSLTGRLQGFAPGEHVQNCDHGGWH
jgi:penicillin-binding protein 2